MSVKLFNPEGLPKPELYAHVAVATGSKMVYLSGQAAHDANDQPVGEGDLAAQIEQCYLNIATALAGVGGTFDDLVRLTIYVVDWSPEKLALLGEGVFRAAEKLGVDPIKPTSLVGVAALESPEILVEVEATAVLE
jgi:enamine deaminase RidA (YjgF/YER057c/UK114 family)